jgi:hypothetical protein
MAAAFRKGCPDFSRPRTDSEWLRIWEKFVVAYAERRANRRRLTDDLRAVRVEASAG